MGKLFRVAGGSRAAFATAIGRVFSSLPPVTCPHCGGPVEESAGAFSLVHLGMAVAVIELSCASCGSVWHRFSWA